MIFLTCVSNAISKDASSIIRWDESLLKIKKANIYFCSSGERKIMFGRLEVFFISICRIHFPISVAIFGQDT